MVLFGRCTANRWRRAVKQRGLGSWVRAFSVSDFECGWIQSMDRWRRSSSDRHRPWRDSVTRLSPNVHLIDLDAAKPNDPRTNSFRNPSPVTFLAVPGRPWPRLLGRNRPHAPLPQKAGVGLLSVE